MTEDRFDEFLRDAAPGYNRPPEPPREEMWAAIRERLGLDEVPAPDVTPLDRRRRRPWLLGVVAVAAALVVGFGLGRITGALGPTSSPSAAVAAADTEARRPSLPYRLAASEHLGQAEAMLIMFRSGSDDAVEDETVAWARDLLARTRALMDSPAGEDPRTRQLLEDVELILVQIVMLSGTDGEEARMVRNSLEDRDLLLKLRAVVPAGPTMMGS